MKPLKIYSRSLQKLFDEGIEIAQTIEFDDESKQYKVTEECRATVITQVSIDSMQADKEMARKVIANASKPLVSPEDKASAESFVSAIVSPPVQDEENE